MPQTTPERCARWYGPSEETAMNYLEDRGFKLTFGWGWQLPYPEHKPTKKEADAIIFLIEEWDFDGIDENPDVKLVK